MQLLRLLFFCQCYQIWTWVPNSEGFLSFLKGIPFRWFEDDFIFYVLPLSVNMVLKSDKNDNCSKGLKQNFNMNNVERSCLLYFLVSNLNQGAEFWGVSDSFLQGCLLYKLDRGKTLFCFLRFALFLGTALKFDKNYNDSKGLTQILNINKVTQILGAYGTVTSVIFFLWNGYVILFLFFFGMVTSVILFFWKKSSRKL